MGIFAEVGEVMMEERKIPSQKKLPEDPIPAAPPFEGDVIEEGEDIIPVVINYICSPPLRTIVSEEQTEENEEAPKEKELEDFPNEETSIPVESERATEASADTPSVIFEGKSEIHGKMKGNLVSKDSLVIYGEVSGNVSANKLILHGTIYGSVTCKSLTLCSDKNHMSQVKGSISTDALFTEFT